MSAIRGASGLGAAPDPSPRPSRGGGAVFVALIALLPVCVVAQPRLVPAGNVDVLYRLEGAAVQQIPGGAPEGVRLEWDAAGQRLRAEPVGQPVYAIVDLRRRVASVVFAAQSAILELPLRGGDPQTLLAGADARFTRRGTGHVLGMECTEWAMQARRVDATGCVTQDGVVLRAEGSWNGQPGRATALSVERGPVPDAAFVPPANFFRLPLGTR